MVVPIAAPRRCRCSTAICGAGSRTWFGRSAADSVFQSADPSAYPGAESASPISCNRTMAGLLESAKHHQRDEMPNVRTLRPEVPAPIAEVVAKACAKDKSVRYASAERMKIALVAAVRASRADSESPILQMTGYPVMPEASQNIYAQLGLPEARVRASDLSFRLAPRINAAGRINTQHQCWPWLCRMISCAPVNGKRGPY